ncbi:MAG TPA: PHP domain-containing protein [Candidatus Limnocylindrales bacterium]|nr:PHP domain-containing protein [Candidatus Limnocylindrales bacterium]
MPAKSNGRANLHLHTTASDGELSPRQVVDAHAAAGFAVIAITDHDTLAGIDALGDLDRLGVRLVPGVELSIEDDPARGLVEVHLLGYGFALRDPGLRARLSQASQEREAQKRETVRRLQAAGYPIDWEAVRARARGNVGKPHIVAAIEAARPGTSREELYALMGPGGLAHVPRAQDLPLEEAVALIERAGGRSVLAHPGVYSHVPDLEVLFETAAARGVRGLEVTYPQDPQDPYGPGSRALMERFAAVAQRYGWVATGGDDFHGPQVTPRIRLAQWTATPAACLDELLASLG